MDSKQIGALICSITSVARAARAASWTEANKGHIDELTIAAAMAFYEQTCGRNEIADKIRLWISEQQMLRSKLDSQPRTEGTVR